MDVISFLFAKPVLIGLHLGFAIIGIDSFLWLAGEVLAGNPTGRRARFAAVLGTSGFALSWLSGGYYYVKFYGTLVKPVIQKGLAPWAHSIIMETKEHIFLFILPLALTAIFVSFLPKEVFEKNNLKRGFLSVILLLVFLALVIGLMGFIISAAARWG